MEDLNYGVSDELRAEQENANSCEKNRRALEFKVDNLFLKKTSVLVHGRFSNSH